MAKVDNTKAQEDLLGNLTNKTYGVTKDLLDFTDIKDDINFNIGKSGSTATATGNITDITTRNGRRIESLDTAIQDSMESIGNNLVHSIPYNDRIKLNRELNYMLTNMPQLKTTLTTLAEFIMCPDNYTGEGCTYDVFIGANSKNITNSDVEAYIVESETDKHIKEGIEGSLSLGYLYKAVVPYATIAERILNKLTDPKSNSGKAISNKKKKSVPSMYGEGLKLMGMTDSENVIFDNIELETYRKLYSESETRVEMLDMLVSAVDEVMGLNSDVSTVKRLYSESYIKNKVSTYPEFAVASNMFVESPYRLEDRSTIMLKMHNLLMGKSDIITDDGVIGSSSVDNMINYYSEAENKAGDSDEFKKALKTLRKNAKSKRKSKVSEMTGCHVYTLDNEKMFPIIVNKEVIGVYCIETFEDLNMQKALTVNVNNVIGSSKYNDAADYRDNPIVRREVVRNLSGIITKHMDANFIMDNRRILGSIEKILDEDSMQFTNYRVRFIPRKYLVPFNAKDCTNGLGKSELIHCRVPASYWILANVNTMMNKLFYEKDKLVIRYRTTAHQDLFNDRQDAMEIFTNLMPLPSELMDLTRTHSSMASMSRLLVPMDAKGTPLFEIDRIEGQDESTKDEDFKEKIEKNIENILGFPLSTLNNDNSKYDFATAIVAQDGRLATKIKNYQVHYSKPATELATKIARYETGLDDIFVNVTFQEPKVLPKSISNENAEKFSTDIDNIMLVHYGEEALNEMEPLQKTFIRREIVKRLYPSMDHTDMLAEIENSYAVKRDGFIAQNTKDDE